MAVDTSYVQSSLELNPRWSAPEVIGSGHYSTAADVYSFGVVLWELLTWQVGERARVCVGGGGLQRSSRRVQLWGGAVGAADMAGGWLTPATGGGGSPAYDEQGYSTAADVDSFGVVLWVLLTWQGGCDMSIWLLPARSALLHTLRMEINRL